MIPYNDCLYRNMYRYKYIALLDIDEVILPIEEHNWSDLMKNVQLLAGEKNDPRIPAAHVQCDATKRKATVKILKAQFTRGLPTLLPYQMEFFKFCELSSNRDDKMLDKKG